MTIRRHTRVAAALAVAVIAATALPAAAATALDAKLEKIRQDWEVPGMAVAVVKDGEIRMARGFGVRRLGSDQAVTGTTRFSIGSCTKAFTVAAIATLVDAGLITWDDEVAPILPGFAMPDPSDTGRVTIRDLLAHRTGLEGGDLLSWGSTLTRAEIVADLRYLLQVAPLRSEFHYNNNVYDAAGEVVAAVAGRPWEAVIAADILDPLGMRATTTSITAIPATADVASPHAEVDGRLQPIPPMNEDNIAAAGSIWSTAEDISRWMLMLLDRGRSGERRILSEASIDAMWTMAMPVPPEEEWERWPAEDRPHLSGYGLGWNLYDSRGRLIVTHEGMSDGFVAGIMLVPEERLGIAVFANRHDSDVARPVMLTLLDAWSDHPASTDWNALYLDLERETEEPAAPGERSASAVCPKRPHLDLAAYAGTYDNPAVGPAVVTVTASGLHLQLPRTPLYSADLSPLDGDIFTAHHAYPLVDDSSVAFAVSPGSASIVGFTLVPDATGWLAGIDYRFSRVEATD